MELYSGLSGIRQSSWLRHQFERHQPCKQPSFEAPRFTEEVEMKHEITDQVFVRLPLHDAIIMHVTCDFNDNDSLTLTVSLEINPYEPLDEFAAMGLVGDKLSLVFEDADFSLRGDGNYVPPQMLLSWSVVDHPRRVFDLTFSCATQISVSARRVFICDDSKYFAQQA